MNITVPASMVTKDQVYSTSAKGCSSINSPTVMSTQAAISIFPRRNHAGQRLRGESVRWAFELDV